MPAISWGFSCRKAGLHRSSAGAVRIEASSRDGPRYIGTSLRYGDLGWIGRREPMGFFGSKMS